MDNSFTFPPQRTDFLICMILRVQRKCHGSPKPTSFNLFPPKCSTQFKKSNITFGKYYASEIGRYQKLLILKKTRADKQLRFVQSNLSNLGYGINIFKNHYDMEIMVFVHSSKEIDFLFSAQLKESLLPTHRPLPTPAHPPTPPYPFLLAYTSPREGVGGGGGVTKPRGGCREGWASGG